MTRPLPLRRSLGLVQIVLYGLGTTIGAGIYALVGEVAGVAGTAAPAAFAIAVLMAGFTAFSFAEMVARFPFSAGSAVYVHEGFARPWLTVAVGLMVVASGTVSAAAIANGFVGYLQEFASVGREAVIVGLVATLGLLAAWGIAQSVSAAGLFTIVETGGLIAVIAFGVDDVAASHMAVGDFLPGPSLAAWGGAVAGALLAFYAFLGFEDMVNVAEEVKDATRTVPLAIILTLGVTLLLYIGVTVVAVAVAEPRELAGSGAPVALVFARVSAMPSRIISVVALFAIVNGALIQMIMAARVLYGLSRRGLLPGALQGIGETTRTPLLATFVVSAMVLAMALWFRIAVLAEATSLIALIVFTLVNLSLIRVKRRDPRPLGVRVYPMWVPVLGAMVSLFFLVQEMVRRTGLDGVF